MQPQCLRTHLTSSTSSRDDRTAYPTNCRPACEPAESVNLAGGFNTNLRQTNAVHYRQLKLSKRPGQSFKNQTFYTPGTTLEIVGKDTADDCWQVLMPNNEDTSWVWGQYATASGVMMVSRSMPRPQAQAVPRPGLEQLLDLLLRLNDHWQSYCTFHSEPDCLWTNNATERAIGSMKMRARTVRGYKS